MTESSHSCRARMLFRRCCWLCPVQALVTVTFVFTKRPMVSHLLVMPRMQFLCMQNRGPADCLVNMSTLLWCMLKGSKKIIMLYTYYHKNPTFTVTCFTVPFATTNPGVLSKTYNYFDGKSNRIALKYCNLIFHNHLASAILSDIGPELCKVLWPE